MHRRVFGEMKNLLNVVKGKKRRLSGQSLSAVGLFAFSAVFSILLLSNCDVIGGSIDGFIEFNTGDAEVVSWRFTSTSVYSRMYNKTEEIWMHYPANDYMEMALQIDNPLKYDLKLTPDVYRYIGLEGVESNAAPAGMPINLRLIDSTNATLTIGNQPHDERVNRGDCFWIRVHVAAGDGTRDFGYYDLPRIIYDTTLLPPSSLGVPIIDGQPYASWKIQSSAKHVGINRISIRFDSAIANYHMGPWYYVYTNIPGTENYKWIMQDIPGEIIKEEYKELLVNTDSAGTPILSLPFPLQDSIDYDHFSDNYNFTVILEDKNGVTSEATSNAVVELLQLDSINVFRIVHDSLDGIALTADPVFQYKEGEINYSLAEPYEVDAVRIEVDKKYDNQKVKFNNNTNDQDIFECGLSKFGTNSIEMIVEWFEPDSDTSTDNIVYTFSFYRNPPDRDSTLKELKVKDSSDNYYDMSPVFIRPPDNVNEQFNIEKNYTVYVSHDVEEVSFEWEFLSYSEVSSRRSGESIWDKNPAHDYIDTILDPNFLGSHPAPPASYGGRLPGIFYDEEWFYNSTDNYRYDYFAGAWVNSNVDYSSYVSYFGNFDESGSPFGLEIWRSSWSYAVDHGENNFEIMVKPKAGDSRSYFIRVIRAALNDNPDARLQSLSVTGAAVEFTPSFNEGLFNYTVNVPNGTSTVTLAAQAKAGAGIIEVLSSPGPNPDFTAGKPVSTPVSVTEGESKLITIKVNGGPVGAAPNNYLVQINGNLPALSSAPELTGGDRSLTVSWASAAGRYYDVCHGTSQNQGSATVWRSNIPAAGANTSTTITGLTNNQTRYVWVRQRNAAGIVGEWTRARTTPDPKYGTPVNSGKAGVARITALVTNPAGFSPDFNSEVNEYILDIPSGTFSFTPTFAAGVTIYLNDSPVTTFPASGNAPGTAGGTNTVNTIRAVSPDGKTFQDYTITIRRMLNAPEGFKLTQKSERMVVEWDPVDNVNLNGPGFYEIFYRNTKTNQTKSLEIPATAVAPLKETVTITDLINKDPYEVRVRARRSDGLLGHESSDTKTPDDGNFKIIVTLPGGIPEEYNWASFWNQGTISRSWNAGGLLDYSVSGAFSSYEWFIDGNSVSTTYSMSENIRDYSQGTHYLSVRFVETDGYVYSKTITLIITQ